MRLNLLVRFFWSLLIWFVKFLKVCLYFNEKVFPSCFSFEPDIPVLRLIKCEFFPIPADISL